MANAVVDKRGRVSLSTTSFGGSYVWKKDGLIFATTATGAVIDPRPNKNYMYVPAQACSESDGTFSNSYNSQHKSTGGNARKTLTINGQVTFTFIGCEFGVVFDKPSCNSDPDPLTFAECRIDGGAWETINIDCKWNYNLFSVVCWGKHGLVNTAHTVNLRLKTDPSAIGMTFDGYFYTNRSSALGVPVEYSVVIDGTTTETVTVTPRVDRHAVIAGWVDQIAALYAVSTPTDYQALTDYLGTLAMAYLMTGDSRLRTCANQLYAAYIANSNASTGVLNSNNSLTWNARIGYNFWLAYKIFGDAKYLIVAERIVSYLLLGWPTGSSSYNGTTYHNLWLATTAGQAVEMDGNRWSCPAYSCCLLYNEPSSIHYRNIALKQRLLDNAAWSMTSVNPTTGVIILGPNHDTRPSRIYGSFQFEHLRYIYETFNDQTAHVSAMELAAQWLASFGMAEPWWWEESLNGSVPNCGSIVWDCNAFDKAGIAIDPDYIDRAYSAACAYSYGKYDPRGSAADVSLTVADLINATIFAYARPAWVAGVSTDTWGESLVGSFAMPSAVSAPVFNIPTLLFRAQGTFVMGSFSTAPLMELPTLIGLGGVGIRSPSASGMILRTITGEQITTRTFHLGYWQ